jgi:hypothetical protein
VGGQVGPGGGAALRHARTPRQAHWDLAPGVALHVVRFFCSSLLPLSICSCLASASLRISCSLRRTQHMHIGSGLVSNSQVLFPVHTLPPYRLKLSLQQRRVVHQYRFYPNVMLVRWFFEHQVAALCLVICMC